MGRSEVNAISPGEIIYLWRRRATMDRREAAKVLGISEQRLREAEKGEWTPREYRELLVRSGINPSFYRGTYMTPAESLIIARRRAGLTQVGLGKVLGCSHVRVLEMEQGLRNREIPEAVARLVRP